MVKNSSLKRNFSAIGKEPFDLAIIGGGIIGTGVARDAALRGLSVLLVEKDDFACGTTSRSTRLIHGGLRYLRMFDFKLVHQDLREREILLHIAPHLVHRLDFVIPLLKSAPFYRFTLPFGLRLYNLLSHGTSLPPCHRLSLSETIKLEPSLAAAKGLVGAFLYYDAQAEYTERLCIENVLDAAAKGAVILNHAEMTDIVFEDGAASGIHIKDTLAGDEYRANARIILNASGPWIDLVLHKCEAGRAYKIRNTKGIHLFTSKISENALVLFAKSDGRLIFVVPWFDSSLIGTTDTDYSGDLDNVHAEKVDVDYLVAEACRYFPDFKPDKIHFTCAGLRPLVPSGRKSPSNTSRAHKLVDHEAKDGIKGFISVMGGKNTAYRGIAEEVVDLVCDKLKIKKACLTASTRLPGAPVVITAEQQKIAQINGLPVAAVAHLSSIYGSRLATILKYVNEDKRLGSPISAGGRDILAQIKHAVLEEQALSVSDFMMRRSFIGLRPDQGRDAVETVAREMAVLLGWSAVETRKQVADFLSTADLGCLYKQ
jgi:glycerol-3-phosphate dehydrogenase